MTGSGACVLADVLRTGRARLRPLIPDSPATVTLRQACRARKDLVRHRVAVGNQLRAHLLCAFPGAVGPVIDGNLNGRQQPVSRHRSATSRAPRSGALSR